jgi:hypothetical protein
MALSKDNLQTIVQNTLSQADRTNRYDGFIDLLGLLSLDELDLCFHIINDSKNTVSQTFDAFGTFLDPAELPSTFTVPAGPTLQSSLPSFSSLPRTTAIRITMVSLRFDDYTQLNQSKQRDLYLYKIADEYTGLLYNRLPQPNAPKDTRFRKNTNDRSHQIEALKSLIEVMVSDITDFELKTVSQLIVDEILNSMAKEESIVAELIGALLALGFEKVLETVVSTISGMARRELLNMLTSSNRLAGLFVNNGPSVFFDSRAVYAFLTEEGETNKAVHAVEAGMQKTLHAITSKAFIDVDKVMQAAEDAKRDEKIKEADELRNLLIDYITMLKHTLLAIKARLGQVYTAMGEINTSATDSGYDLLSDDDLDALYMFVFGYDYKVLITKFIEDYNANIKDIGLVENVPPSVGSWNVGVKDYRVATWLVWKAKAYLVLSDVPFSRAALDVRVYNAMPKTIKAAAVKKTELVIAAHSDDFGGKWPILYATSPPLIPLDHAYSIEAAELRNMYANVAARDRIQYPTDKPFQRAAASIAAAAASLRNQ